MDPWTNIADFFIVVDISLGGISRGSWILMNAFGPSLKKGVIDSIFDIEHKAQTFSVGTCKFALRN